ncbi:MAG: hypothetical protein RQ856_02775 [Candidatus Izemoplasmatales bacterium]|nr:hypothetical protein [Candidatus Izemoplasmatales bacterium]
MKNKKLLLSFLLLTIIYLAFIALGLPDALLGSDWNLVRDDLFVSLGTLGFMTLIIYIMSIISSYNAPKTFKIIPNKMNYFCFDYFYWCFLNSYESSKCFLSNALLCDSSWNRRRSD